MLGIWLLLCLGISIAFTGCWRSHGAPTNNRVTLHSYDGSLPDDKHVDSPLCCVDVYGLNPETAKPVVAYVHGGKWHRGHRSSWLYAGNFAAAAAQHGVIGASIGYRTTKAAGLILYVLYPLSITLYATAVCSVLLVPLAAFEIISWGFVGVIPVLLSSCYIWTWGMHPWSTGGNFRVGHSSGTIHDMLSDVARACRRLKDSQSNQHKFKLHLVGHSAGAHLVSLLLDKGEEYLRPLGIIPGDVIGCAGISGPYDICKLDEALTNFPLFQRTFMRHMALKPCFGSEEAAWSTWSPSGEGEYVRQCQWLILSGLQERAGLFRLIPELGIKHVTNYDCGLVNHGDC